MDNAGSLALPDATQNQDTVKPKSLLFNDYRDVFTQLVNEFDEKEGARIKKRREFRRHVVNVEEMREQKKLLPDETAIPDRTIDSNIRTSKPPFVRYLTEPTTVLSFTDAAYPNANYTPLADYYTKINREPGWQIEWLFMIDSEQVHGAGYLEVVPADNACGTTVQYVRRDHLIFADNARSLNAQATVLRVFEFTKPQFEAFAAAQRFDPVETAKVSAYMDTRRTFVRIYRAYIRNEGVIKLGYIADSACGCSDWLLAPQAYGLGELVADPLDPKKFSAVPLTDLPITVFPLDLEEDEEINRVQGRVALDLHVQDALTQVVSSTVNTAYRASGLYPTKEDPDSLGKPPEAMQLRHGMVAYGKYAYNKIDWPNAIAISLAQFLRTTGATQAGQPDWTAMNRADTAKTAYEINAAREEAARLSSVSVTLFALCALRVELIRWRVWLSLVRAGVKQPPEFCVPPAEGQAPQINLFSPTLVPTMSADQQVVRQAELMAKYVQYLPMVAGTPYHLPMLESMLASAFPLQIDNWKLQANTQMQLQQAVGQSLQTIAAVFQELRKLDLAVLPDDQQATMTQLINELGTYLQQNAPAQPATK